MNPTLEKIFSSYFANYKIIDLTDLQKSVLHEKYNNSEIEVCGRIKEIHETFIELTHEIFISKWRKYATTAVLERYEFVFSCCLQNPDKEFLFTLKKGQYLTVKGIIEKFDIKEPGSAIGLLDVSLKSSEIKNADVIWADNKYFGLPVEDDKYKQDREARERRKAFKRKKAAIKKRLNSVFGVIILIIFALILLKILSEIYGFYK